jgi:subtilisin family serine protease
MKEYNVILKKDVDYDGFWEDMETETEGLLYIPNRRIEFTNERPGSLRQCWYLLTDEEAEIVRQDPRVLAVELPPEHRDDIQIGLRKVQEGVFTKTTSDSGNYQNWSLIRSKFITNIFGTSSTTTEKYVYNLDGSGVDIVIQDSGIQIDHPEFEDENGNTRFVSVNWGTLHGGFTQSANHDRDWDGHGTHCGGIAAGKTFGWAKNARIHHQKILGLEGNPSEELDDSGNGISPSYAFDAIKLWHAAKPIDPKTGFKRPTVVNMSWGYLSSYTSVSEINYRGVSYTGANIDTTTERNNNYGLITNYFSFPTTFMTNVRIASVDTDIEELLDAGVVVCIAAGNRAHKIDIPGGTDFNNYAVTNVDTEYYHRGSSPYGDAGLDGGPRAIIVGSMDSTVYSVSQDYKATYSETGPGVDIYAPGTDIMSCTSTTNKWGAGSQNYYLDSNYKQTNISGTSMASPQVAGVAALLLQLNPGLSPAKVKEYLTTNCGTAIYDTGVGNDWTNNRSLKSGSAKVLFCGFDINKNTQQEPLLASGNFETFFPFQLQKR